MTWRLEECSKKNQVTRPRRHRAFRPAHQRRLPSAYTATWLQRAPSAGLTRTGLAALYAEHAADSSASSSYRRDQCRALLRLPPRSVCESTRYNMSAALEITCATRLPHALFSPCAPAVPYAPTQRQQLYIHSHGREATQGPAFLVVSLDS
ncbi:hypothetical protein HYPSUDRAFT_46293 [Hypholoma sublateritium FD-334 SS-4]|uniref:Uncharacterized protein n=1 Tax=Hypholoma sublateritium (strain FD-334 SS-4) TaxID=945553 RepID=A0A0D2PB03_HYPSF|nr:hypothetical protein HYPSUDRAFT_46293 [Hypholoma sublateritium FD-334 SS-4]